MRTVDEKRFYFDPYARGAAVFLGPTEARVMEAAWKKQAVTVKQVLFSLDGEPELAYTTVMTVMNRLADKGFLNRHKSGRSFSYEAASDRKTFLDRRVSIVSQCLARNFAKKR